MLTHLAGVAAAALALSVGLVYVTRRWARRRMLDHPNDRSLHQQPTPRGGGIGIVVPVCLAVGGVAVFDPASRGACACLAAAGSIVALIGLLDDIRGLPALPRLAAQSLAAGLIVAGIGVWHVFTWPGVGSIAWGWAALPVTALWIVGLSNAYNFMDGTDGIAGSQAVVAGLGWVAIGFTLQDPVLAWAGAAVASASFGFLFFNWSPASIFMGDVGSSFLGFVLGALVVLASIQSPSAATAGVLLVWPFVFDTAFTLLRRARRRENLLQAHRSHLYQRLVLTGLSHRTVAALYALLACVGVAVGLGLVYGATSVARAGALLIALLATALWAEVVRRERSPAPRRAAASTR